MSVVSLGNLFGEYKPYPKYRKSGVYWLEEIPELWDIKPIWLLFIRKSDKGHGDLQLLSVYRDYGVIPTDSRDDNFNKPSLDLSSYLRVTPTDLVTNKMKTWQGSIAVSEYEGIVSPAYYTCRAVHREHHKYIHYLLRCGKYVSIYMSLSKGIRVNQWDLEYQSFRNVPVLLPSFNEQQAIAEFLDKETARIAELIGNKQKLIDLLREQRTALITRTVTKGLNPAAPMRDSGIEWLGEIPAHWEVNRLKWGANLINDKVENGETDTIYLGLENVESWTGRIVESDFRPEQEEASSSFRKDDVLFGKLRPYLAKAIHAQYHGICTSELMVLRPQKYYPRYLFYYMLSRSTVNIIDSSTYGVKMPRANWQFIGNLPTPLPPLREQQAIADFLDKETSRIDSLVGRINQAIEKLQEYRSAIITAAVIGKIDIRTKGAIHE